MSKKVCIVGPIGNFGGREVEVNIIAKALENHFNVSIVSTTHMTKSSFALQNLKKSKWLSLNDAFYKSSFIVRLLSFLSKKINKGKGNVSEYATNSISNKFYPIEKQQWQFLEKELSVASSVVLCVQLTSKFLKETVEYCFERKIPCFIRTTGTIRRVDVSKFAFLKKATLFIHHSEQNANNLNTQMQLPYCIIDQCALNENLLLKLPISVNEKLVFGYLGRLTQEKGVLQFLQKASLGNLNLVIAGDGNLKEEILSHIEKFPNIKYIGKLESENIIQFFKKIDVLIIPSLEESGPLVALEAMAAGKLILSTNVGAMKERLEGLDSYWFDIERSKDELDNIIQQIQSFDSVELLMQQKKIRQKYLADFSKIEIEKKYVNLIEKYI